MDETTILNFRHLLERHSLTEALFSEVSAYLEERALLLRGGTIMGVSENSDFSTLPFSSALILFINFTSPL